MGRTSTHRGAIIDATLSSKGNNTQSFARKRATCAVAVDRVVPRQSCIGEAPNVGPRRHSIGYGKYESAETSSLDGPRKLSDQAKVVPNHAAWATQLKDLHRVVTVTNTMFLLLLQHNEALLRVAIEMVTDMRARQCINWSDSDGWYADDERREGLRNTVFQKLRVVLKMQGASHQELHAVSEAYEGRPGHSKERAAKLARYRKNTSSSSINLSDVSVISDSDDVLSGGDDVVDADLAPKPGPVVSLGQLQQHAADNKHSLEVALAKIRRLEAVNQRSKDAEHRAHEAEKRLHSTRAEQNRMQSIITYLTDEKNSLQRTLDRVRCENKHAPTTRLDGRSDKCVQTVGDSGPPRAVLETIHPAREGSGPPPKRREGPQEDSWAQLSPTTKKHVRVVTGGQFDIVPGHAAGRHAPDCVNDDVFRLLQDMEDEKSKFRSTMDLLAEDNKRLQPGDHAANDVDRCLHELASVRPGACRDLEYTSEESQRSLEQLRVAPGRGHAAALSRVSSKQPSESPSQRPDDVTAEVLPPDAGGGSGAHHRRHAGALEPPERPHRDAAAADRHEQSPAATLRLNGRQEHGSHAGGEIICSKSGVQIRLPTLQDPTRSHAALTQAKSSAGSSSHGARPASQAAAPLPASPNTTMSDFSRTLPVPGSRGKRLIDRKLNDSASLPNLQNHRGGG